MKKAYARIALTVFLVCLVPSLPLFAGERAFSWTNAPGQGDFIGAAISQYSLGKYLGECQVNRPEIVQEVYTQIKQGKYYRKRTKDQKGKPTVLTVHLNPEYKLRILTYRNETCPVCKGTGKKEVPLEKVTRHVGVNFSCYECKGKGELENFTTEKFFVLSSEDFEEPEIGRRLMHQQAYANAPEGAQAWVERLASPNPRERLEACLWLDQNYVRTGGQFLDIQPMLRKARYHDSDTKKRIMVWQFWAGKDMPNEKNRAYYRIYADPKTGKITKKGFFSGS